MVQEILIELARGIGRLFLHPALYVTLLFSVLIGYFRVKRERRQFKARVLWGGTEAKRLFEGYLLAIILSVLSLLVGLVIPSSWILVLSGWMLLMVVLFVYQLGSPIYAFALTFVTLLVMDFYNLSFTFLDWEVQGQGILDEAIVPFAILAGLLLIAEGILIQRFGGKSSSPRLVKTARGIEAMEYVAKRLWILPIFIVVPGDIVHTYLPYWSS